MGAGRTPVFRTGETDTGRVEAFSDGVLAIVITLLILDVKIPDHVQGGDAALWSAIGQQLPMIGAWALSFFYVLVFWVAHHYFFRILKHIDRGLLWLNGLFLLCISFTPVPTALLGLYPSMAAASTMLSIAMFLTSLSFLMMRWYATHHAKLIADHHRVAANLALQRSILAPSLYFCAILAAQVSIPLSIALQTAVPLIFFLPPRQS